MSADPSSFETHPSDALLILLGDVHGESMLLELVDELARETELGPVTSASGAPAGVKETWTHLQDCSTCTTRLDWLLGLVPSALAVTPIDPQWTAALRDEHIRHSLDAFVPSPGYVDTAPTAAVVRSFRPFRRAGGRGSHSSTRSARSDGAAILSRRWPIASASVGAAAVIVVGITVGFRPTTSQNDAARSRLATDTEGAASETSAASASASAVSASASESASASSASASPRRGPSAKRSAAASPSADQSETPRNDQNAAGPAVGVPAVEPVAPVTADLGSFPTYDAVLDRFGDPQRDTTSGGASASVAAQPPTPAGVSLIPCSSTLGELRVTATVDAKPVIVVRTAGPSGRIDLVLDAASCIVLAQRSSTASGPGP